MTSANKEAVIMTLLIVIMSWLCLSVLGSAIVADNESCAKNYPVGDVVFIKMFCEIKE